jgi:hypothetical protein
MVSYSLCETSGPWDALRCLSLTETSATGYDLYIIYVRSNGGVKRQHNYATGD